MALPQQNRLRSNRDFSRVHRKGKRAATKHLALKALKRKSQSSGIKRIAPKRDAAQRLFQPSHKPVLKAHVVASRSDDITKQSDTKPNGNRIQPIGSIKDQGADGSPFAPLSCGAQSTTHVEGPQFGISISRKVSKRAVVRNRIKRQLKAIIREHFISINPAWQIVIVVRPPAVECSFDEFLRELKYLLQKLAALE